MAIIYHISNMSRRALRKAYRAEGWQVHPGLPTSDGPSGPMDLEPLRFRLGRDYALTEGTPLRYSRCNLSGPPRSMIRGRMAGS